MPMCRMLNVRSRTFLSYLVFQARSHTYSTRKGESLEHLSKRKYWKEKYRDTGIGNKSFDWFVPPEAFPGIIEFAFSTAVNKQPTTRNYPEQDVQAKLDKTFQRQQSVRLPCHHVLDLGCGLSQLPLNLYLWKHFPLAVICLDYVQEAVDYQLHSLQTVTPGCQNSFKYGACADACQLPFRNDCFDLVMDKGTMDALLKNTQEGALSAKQMLFEAYRVLNKGGGFVQLTDEDPDSRLPFLESISPDLCQWNFSVLTGHWDDSQEYFLYYFTK